MSSVDDALREQIDALQGEHGNLSDRLKEVGISLRKEDGSLKTFYELFSELYDKMYVDEKYEFLDIPDNES